MGVREVKPIFQDSTESIGKREFMVLPTSGTLSFHTSVQGFSVKVYCFLKGLTGDGVTEGIDWLVQCIIRNNDVRPPKGNQED